jgi:hypothetical protein
MVAFEVSWMKQTGWSGFGLACGAGSVGSVGGWWRCEGVKVEVKVFNGWWVGDRHRQRVLGFGHLTGKNAGCKMGRTDSHGSRASATDAA